MAVLQWSMTPASVCRWWPLRDSSSSRLRLVGPSMMTASSRSCTPIDVRWGRAVFCVSVTYCSRAPAAAIPRGKASQPKPDRSLVPNWPHSRRVALSSSKCHGGRCDIRMFSSKSRSIGLSSSTISSAGRKRWTSPWTASRSGVSLRRKRPADRSSQAMPKLSPSVNTAATTLSRSADSSASSVSVPGVTMRVTLRSTGPLLVAGSPICSQMATDSPLRTSFAR